MIYTSYFGNLRNIDKMIPVSICSKTPNWYEGLEYKKLAPSYDILMEYKRTGDKYRYTQRYQKEILNKLNQMDVLKDLYEMTSNVRAGKRNIVLLCYEKPTDFCHRHIVADWMGMGVSELVK